MSASPWETSSTWTTFPTCQTLPWRCHIIWKNHFEFFDYIFLWQKVWEVDIDVAAVGEAEALVLPSGERLPLWDPPSWWSISTKWDAPMIFFLHGVFSHEISEDDDIFGFTTYDFESEENDSEADITIDADETVRALNSRSFYYFLLSAKPWFLPAA